MQDLIGRAYTSTPLEEVEPGRYVARVEAPDTGYTAYFVEMSFPSGISAPFKFSTGIKVVPDVTEHNWQQATESERLQAPPHP